MHLRLVEHLLLGIYFTMLFSITVFSIELCTKNWIVLLQYLHHHNVLVLQHEVNWLTSVQLASYYCQLWLPPPPPHFASLAIICEAGLIIPSLAQESANKCILTAEIELIPLSHHMWTW